MQQASAKYDVRVHFSIIECHVHENHPKTKGRPRYMDLDVLVG